MAAPDRRVVVNALWIMPHSIGIDEVSPVRRDYFTHASVNVVGHPRNQSLGSRSQALRPAAAHQIMVATNASRGHDHGLRFYMEFPHNAPGTGRTTLASP